jgi:hypothetical protein
MLRKNKQEFPHKERTQSIMNKLEKLHIIVANHQYEEIEEYVVDVLTASLLLKVHDALSPKNQEKFLNFPIEKMVEISWKLVN